MGSDTACEVCIHGEGILPVHAYLRSDGGKVLIRPANNEISSGSSRVAITVGGSLITGPATVIDGQGVSIGAVQLTLMRAREQRASAWSRTWVRWSGYTLAGLAAIALLGAVCIRYIYLDEEALKARFKNVVHQALGRPLEQIDIGAVKVRMFDSRLDIQNLTVKERPEFQSATSSNFIHVPSITLTFELWPYIKSFGSELRKLDIAIDGDGINNPEMLLERSKVDGVLNANDIIQFLSAAPRSSLKLSHLDFVLKLNNGAIRLRDPYTGIGETSLENLAIELRQSGPGSPLQIARCEMKVDSSPPPPEKGALSVTGEVNFLDESCTICPDKISTEELKVEMKNFDLGRIFEHLGYAWEPHGSNFKVVLGKPIHGSIDVSFASARELKLQAKITSQSLLSIKEDKQPPLGNIPMELNISDLHLVRDNSAEGGRFVPNSMDMRLESWADSSRREAAFLTFSTNGKLNSSGKYTYSVDLVCGLQELLNTDVGKRLKLDGTLGGGLEGHAELIVDAGTSLGIDARLNGRDTYVMVPVPEDADKPVDKRRMMKQPLPLNFDCFIDARQTGAGGIAYIDVQRFLLNASSFKAHSDKPMRIDIRSADEKIKADAQFQLDLKGKEFCREFSPILSLFGFTKSLDEDFDLKISVFGRNDILGMLADGKMTRKWAPDPAPVRLKSSFIYNKPAKARGELPYMSLSVNANTAGEKPLDLQLEAHCTHRDGKDIYECVHHSKDGKDTGGPGLAVNADIETLRGRFDPYIEILLQPSTARGRPPVESMLLNFFHAADLKGQINQQARFKISRSAHEGANETDRIEFDLKTDANLKSSVALEKLSAPKPGAEPAPAQPRFKWDEPKLALELKGIYEQSVTANPEEADKLRMLNVERLNVQGSLGHFTLGLKNLDLLALPVIRNAASREWTDLLGGMTIRGTVSPRAAVLFKSLGIIDRDDPISGTVDIEAAYERDKDSLDFKKFHFKQHDGFYLTELSTSGSLARVREISAQLFPTQPNRDSLAVRLANWIVRDGADVFFGHLGREFSVHSMRLEAKPFREWLTRTFKQSGQPNGSRGSALFAGILDNTWEPDGVWSADALQLTRDPNLPNTWRLRGALQTGFLARVPSAGYDAGAPTVSFSKPWNVEMGLALNKDSIAFDGEILLDSADVAARVPGIKLELLKPAAEPFKIEVSGGAAARGLFPLLLNKLRATGKFGAFELSRLMVEPATGGMRYGVEKFSLDGKGYKFSGSVPMLDVARDNLVARVESPALELGVLPEMWALAPNGTGQLRNVAFSYRGGLTALLASLPPSLRPTLDAGDPRRNGVNPEHDALELEGDFEGAAINLASGAVALGGRVRLTPLELNWKNCNVTVWRSPDVEAGDAIVEPIQTFTVAKLRVKSSDPKLNLRQAFSAYGMPLEISGDMECSHPLDSSQLATLREALIALVPSSPIAGAADFAAARRMLVNMGLKAPSAYLAGVQAETLDARNMLFKDLKLSVPLLSVTLLGGKLLLEDGDYDFSKVAARGIGARDLKGVLHTQRLSYTGADLCRLMGGATNDPKFYSLCGRLDAQGHLNGADFKGMDRLNWNGAQKFTISNFAAGSPIVDPAGEGVAPALAWMTAFKYHGAKRGEVLARASLLENFSPLELSADGIAPPAIKLADGMLAGLELYFAKTFFVEPGRFEFEPFAPTARIDKGLAVFEPFELKGKGLSEGLVLQVRNLKVNLADEILADEVLIFPSAIPKLAQDKLMLDKWPAVSRQAYLTAMASEKLALRITGSMRTPQIKYPWSELRILGRSVFFGVEAISDHTSLNRAREHFYRVWGRDDAVLEPAAMLAERFGTGLPGTLSSRVLKDAIVERAANLVPRLMDAVNNLQNPVPLSPRDSLKLLLTAEPDPPPPPPPPPVPEKGSSKKKNSTNKNGNP